MTGAANGILAGTGLRFQFQAQGLDKDAFNLVYFEFEEGLSTPFEVSMTLLSTFHDLSAADIVDVPGLMQWAENGEIKRQVHGIVKAFSKGDTGHHHTVYHITLVPALSRLKLRQNSRIFQAQSVISIISTILSEMNILDVAFNCDPSLDERLREYCVQYRETDFEFISRLASEEGLFYHFEHTETGHTLVFSDSTQKLSNIGFPFPYNALSGGAADTPFMGEFALTHQVRPTVTRLKDASFHNPAYSFLLESEGEALDEQQLRYEHFDFPGRFKDDDSGQVFTQARLDYLRRDTQVAVGKSNIMQASAGYKFDLAEHIDDTFNRDWLLVQIKHQGIQGAASEGANTSVPTTYHNEVTSIPASSAWQAKPQPKPRVTGPQMATVVGPEGEEIFCDEFGRVKLQFPWDRYSNGDDCSSCWVRVSQGWTGGQYGMMSVPRIGHEVIVSFVEGDPDQPIITGRTHNAINLPPYALPDHQTRTVLKTQSHKGEGSNELHFEDQAGEEVVYFHAQKDMQQLIENDQSLHILGNQHWNITNDRLTQITGNDHQTLESDSLVGITKDSMLAVKASHHQKVAKKQLMKVGSEVHLKSKGELILDAGSEITLSAGGSFLKVDPAGVHLVGSKVNLNSGGGAGSGSQCKVKKPEAALTLDEAICPETGEIIKQAATLEAVESDEVVFEYEAVELEQSQGAMSGSTGSANAQSNDESAAAAGANATSDNESNESASGKGTDDVYLVFADKRTNVEEFAEEVYLSKEPEIIEHVLNTNPHLKQSFSQILAGMPVVVSPWKYTHEDEADAIEQADELMTEYLKLDDEQRTWFAEHHESATNAILMMATSGLETSLGESGSDELTEWNLGHMLAGTGAVIAGAQVQGNRIKQKMESFTKYSREVSERTKGLSGQALYSNQDYKNWRKDANRFKGEMKALMSQVGQPGYVKNIQVKNINRYLNIDKRQLYKAKNFSQSLAGINMSGLYKEAMKFSSQLGKVGWAVTISALYSNGIDLYQQCNMNGWLTEACGRATTKNVTSGAINVIAGYYMGAALAAIPVTGGLSIAIVAAGSLAWGLEGGDISNSLGESVEEFIFD